MNNNKYKQFLNESVYSFDYDSTLIKYRYERESRDGGIEEIAYDQPHRQNIVLLRKLAAEGHKIVIVTSRRIPNGVGRKYHWDNTPSPEELVSKLDLPVSEVHYTQGQPKIKKLVELGVVKHWDDDEEEILHIKRWNQENPKNQIEWELVPVDEGLSESVRTNFVTKFTEDQGTVGNLEKAVLDQFSSHPSGRPYELTVQLEEQINIDNILSSFNDIYLTDFVVRLGQNKLKRNDLRDIITARSIFMFTTLNVNTVRDPEQFDSEKATNPIARNSWLTGWTGPGPISSKKAKQIFNQIPTKTMYQIANNIMLKLATLPNPGPAEPIYRGMILPNDITEALIAEGNGGIFNMRSISSWTADYDTAQDFAIDEFRKALGEGIPEENIRKILFITENPKYGINISGLSGYSKEEEYVLGGRQMLIKEIIVKNPEGQPHSGARHWVIIKVDIN